MAFFEKNECKRMKQESMHCIFYALIMYEYVYKGFHARCIDMHMNLNGTGHMYTFTA
jgi:hypothetical protein